MIPRKRCHCGAELIDLFTGTACKAECDLPPSMRTKPKQRATATLRPIDDPDVWKFKALTGVRPAHAAASGVPLRPWAPAIGEWVRVVASRQVYAGLVYKVGAVGSMVVGTPLAGGRMSMVQFPANEIEPWVPRGGENVQVRTGAYAGYTAFVVCNAGGWSDLRIGSVPMTLRDSELEPAP